MLLFVPAFPEPCNPKACQVSNMDARLQACVCVCVCVRVCVSSSVVPDSATPWTIAKLHCSWDFPDKNSGVGCHFLLQFITILILIWEAVQNWEAKWRSRKKYELRIQAPGFKYWLLPSVTRVQPWIRCFSSGQDTHLWKGRGWLTFLQSHCAVSPQGMCNALPNESPLSSISQNY